ncbi:MAG: tRNA uridine-5-carboxymethylaminomethyl(34) synthesis GTPase MnmE [Flavobacteriaceae bacterium]|nr:tRNA uridine-5-carboxymethylaminomethyl(34) synthesis GTPase MnmE [Flavobacteriaceae bacterium]
MLSKGTIIAPSTPPGSGAIAIIRISGSESIKLTDSFFKSKSGIKLSSSKSFKLILGDFIVNNKTIDEVLISVFKNPNSYTGEDLVEISCHGSSYIKQKIIKSYIDMGVELAQPGEFTLRAYLNKKLDLSQAEAVSDLISSETKSEHKIAINQIKGDFSNAIELIREKLIEFTSLIELELDFSEEDVKFANRKDLNKLINDLKNKLKSLIDSFKYGNVIKDGIPVTIAGRPNSGKSSLINSLLKEEKAIVSNIPGTTRDIIEDTLIIDGLKFRFIDTAGLRKTNDEIESLGIEKAKEKIKKAKVLLYLFDRKDISLKEIIKENNDLFHNDLLIILIENKIDLIENYGSSQFYKNLNKEINKSSISNFIGVSTFNDNHIEKLKKLLIENHKELNNNSDIIISNVRHYNALKKALESLDDVEKSLKNEVTGDLLSIDLKESIYQVGLISGKIDVDQDILSSIFSKFCIGK